MRNFYEITFDETGIERRENMFRIFWLWSVLRGNSGYTTERVLWTEIESAYVYKRDAFTTDLICLAFRLQNGSSFEINESMQGWQNLIENLPAYLPDCINFSDWFMNVAFPAFEMNLTQIYQR
jgi:hypothetical protein